MSNTDNEYKVSINCSTATPKTVLTEDYIKIFNTKGEDLVHRTDYGYVYDIKHKPVKIRYSNLLINLLKRI